VVVLRTCSLKVCCGIGRVQTNQQPTLLYSQQAAQKQLNWPKKLEPLNGLLQYQSLSIDLFSTKEHFMMQYAYTTDADSNCQYTTPPYISNLEGLLGVATAPNLVI